MICNKLVLFCFVFSPLRYGRSVFTWDPFPQQENALIVVLLTGWQHIASFQRFGDCLTFPLALLPGFVIACKATCSYLVALIC